MWIHKRIKFFIYDKALIINVYDAATWNTAEYIKRLGVTIRVNLRL